MYSARKATYKRTLYETDSRAQCAPHRACFPQQSAAIARAHYPARAAQRQLSARCSPHPAAGSWSAGCWGSKMRPDTAPSVASPRPASGQPSLHAHCIHFRLQSVVHHQVSRTCGFSLSSSGFKAVHVFSCPVDGQYDGQLMECCRDFLSLLVDPLLGRNQRSEMPQGRKSLSLS